MHIPEYFGTISKVGLMPEKLDLCLCTNELHTNKSNLDYLLTKYRFWTPKLKAKMALMIPYIEVGILSSEIAPRSLPPKP